MDDAHSRLMEVFLDVQRGLPRQGPGDAGSTRRALALCAELPEEPSILDIGCGPGMQTMALAQGCSGTILAVDTCHEYLDELRNKVDKASLSHRVEARHADMKSLDLLENAFDLIWCEGAIYLLGVPEALQAWRPLLRDQGYLAFSELVWLDASPAAEVAEFFENEYPAMTSVEAIIKTIREKDYDSVGGFTLPESAWWDDYYGPLEAKLPTLKRKYAEDAEALGVIARSEAEIDMRRRFGSCYGYHFFVARKVDEKR